MLSDIICDAEGEMRRELETWPEVHEWLRPRIDALLREMGRVRFLLDLWGLPAESVWVHVQPVLPLLVHEPLAHDEINKLIDLILDQGPPTKEQFQEWANLLVQSTKAKE